LRLEAHVPRASVRGDLGSWLKCVLQAKTTEVRHTNRRADWTERGSSFDFKQAYRPTSAGYGWPQRSSPPWVTHPVVVYRASTGRDFAALLSVLKMCLYLQLSGTETSTIGPEAAF